MCGRFTLRTPAKDLVGVFWLLHTAELPPRYNIAPTLPVAPLDTFGIGYDFIRYSPPVRDFAPFLLPIGNDQAIELFYNYAITPWFKGRRPAVPLRARQLIPLPGHIRFGRIGPDVLKTYG